jgi:uncharacterized protein (DUF433 family)
MNWREYIHRNPKVLVGKPVLIGTRISVELILEEMAAGASEEQLLRSYPHLKSGQIRAALAYAADLVKNDQTLLPPVAKN